MERVTVASRLHNSNTKTDDNVRDIPDGILYKYLYCKSNSDTNVITLSLTLFELYSAQELLNCDIQANGYFFGKVICYGKLFCSTFYKRAREMCRNNYTVCVIIKRQIWRNK